MGLASAALRPRPGGGIEPCGAARVVVDLAAIRDNAALLRECAPRAGFIAVVRADAYGHGLPPSHVDEGRDEGSGGGSDSGVPVEEVT